MDAVKELIDAIKSRLNSSITGSYILSWLVVNWKFIFILFVSPLPVLDRIDLAEDNINYWIGFGVPFIIMIFYVLALPYIELGAKLLLKKSVVSNEILTNSITDEVTGSRDALLRKNKQLENTIANLNQKIGGLENSLKNSEREKSMLLKNESELDFNLNNNSLIDIKDKITSLEKYMKNSNKE